MQTLLHWRRGRRLPPYVWLLVAYVIAFPLLFRPALHGSDPLGYYAWVRSAVIDRDLNVDNEFTDLGFDSYFIAYTPTGHRVDHWSPGPALLWSPFFAGVHGIQSGLRALGFPVSADGYGLPYRSAASFASTVYALIGLILLWKVGRAFASAAETTLAVIAVWFASPLVFYMYSHPMMSHAVDFFVNALFIWVWHRTRNREGAKGWFWRGLSLGLATFVRSQNAVLVVFPALELVYGLVADTAETRANKLLFTVKKGLAFSAGILPFAALQMAFWRVVYGQWFVNAYRYQPGSEDGIFNFREPRFFLWTFSTSNGLFFWSPILLFGLIGLFLLLRRDRRFGLLLLTILVLQVFVVSSIIYTGPRSFGTRYLIGTLPVFVLGMTVWINWLHKYMNLWVLAAAAACFILWNMLLIVQYALETIPRYGPVDVRTLVKNQFTVIPENMQRIINALIARRQEP